eukprot:m.134146 g.134146  ORF g.134146 m.134146 type:complete len:2176 (-) comp9519_c1_seq1:89-6616(-)
MAEQKYRAQQYEYSQNANLVLQANRDLIDRVGRDEATGEVESLKGKLRTVRMGDRAARTMAPELQERKKRHSEKQSAKQRQRAGQQSSFIVRHSDLNLKYYPRTKITQDIYEMILAFITEYIGSQPADILMGAADEVLEILKGDELKSNEKHKELSALLGQKITDKNFNRVSGLALKITDYQDQTDMDEEKDGEDELEDGNAGVALIFDREEEEEDEKAGMEGIAEDDDLNEVRDDFDRGEDDVEPQEAMTANLTAETTMVMTDGINPMDIDAHWIQRQLGKYSKDATETKELADKCFEILAEAKDDRDCENRLIKVLQFDKFEFVKLLRKHRKLIYFCISRAHANSDAERKSIDEAASQDEELAPIVKLLKHGDTVDQGKVDKDRRAAQRKNRLDADLDLNVTDAHVKKVLDLEDLAFHQGGHLMTNKEYVLPKGASRITKDGYEEVIIPALTSKSKKLVTELVKITSLPGWAQKAFGGFDSLNVIQSKLFPTAFGTNENLLVCAPTGAGKTNVALLAILHEIGKHVDENGKVDKDAFKIVYVAPMKSLVAEMTGTFNKRLQPYGLVVEELTGDRSLSREQIFKTNVLVCTPEKWDVITRKGGYEGAVSLIIIDEIHLLHDDRGPVLESLVARSLRQMERTGEKLRLVGLSATLPNYEDVSVFLRVDPKKGLFYFDGGFRPCPLEQKYIGISERKAMKRFQKMNDIVFEKVKHCLMNEQQVIVFTHSRKDTAQTARTLMERCMEDDALINFLTGDEETTQILEESVKDVANSDLAALLPNGFACHHAGMARPDRTIVEELFADFKIRVLVSTATLAWGVNLPAQTVIIKGTQVYSPEKGGWTELSFLDVLQMLGRAGRPQYQENGVGILITSHNELQFYLSLLNESLPVESQFIKKLADNLNAEVVAGTVQNLQDGVDWLSYTYLFVRMLNNPRLYGITEDELKADPTLERARANLIHTAALQLDKANLMKYDKRSGHFQVTDLGRIASHYYCDFKTISMYNNLMKPTLTDIELLRIFSRSTEFEFVRVREEEKLELQTLLERVPIPVKESIDESTAKINVLLQAYISGLRLDGFSLASDMVYITQSAGRLIRALFEIALRHGWCGLTDRTLAFCKMIDRQLWQTRCPLNQFKKLNKEVVHKLERKNLYWSQLTSLNPTDLGELIRQPKLGKSLHKYIHSLPKVEISSYVQPISRTTLKVMLTVTPDFQWNDNVHGSQETFWVFAEDGDGENILHSEYLIIKKRFKEEDHVIEFYVPIGEPMPPQYFIRVVSDKWLGSETVLPISFRHLLLPDKYEPHTKLLDLQPTKIKELVPTSTQLYGGFRRVQEYYEQTFNFNNPDSSNAPIKTFNAMQTQVYEAIFQSDSNVFIGSPTGSGKTVCAEYAILRCINKKGVDSTLCVYIAPKQSLCDKVAARWLKLFGELVGLTVVKLTGDLSADLKLLAAGSIVIGTAEQWDVVSRRYKQRRRVQQVDVFIADEAHLLGAAEGPVMEVVCSRMRLMQNTMEGSGPHRIVLLASPIANATDVARWCGVSKENTFNFSPSVRPIPLELHVSGFTATHPTARLATMCRPVYNAMKRYSQTSPTIVFVPSKKQALVTAAELYSFIATEEDVEEDPHGVADEVAKINDEHLREMLSSDIGYVHESLDAADRKITESLFRAGALRVLVVPSSLAWELEQSAHLVVVQDTQHYDGKDHRYVDYPIPLLLQMMGFATLPVSSSGGATCVVMCHTSKKQHFSKFLFEALPVESHLDHMLHDHFNAAVVTKTIVEKQDAMEYLTWTLLYRRMTRNPNYYNLTGVTHRHLSDHLSELVETTLQELEESKCISIDDDADDISPLNLGMIAAYYYIDYTTIELFSRSLTDKTKLRGLLEILCSASEFKKIPVRYREDRILRALSQRVPLSQRKNAKFNDPHVKANLLIQAHMNRIQLSPELHHDQEEVLRILPRLLQACVDVLSSSSWLSPAITAMELSQFITQAMWTTDTVLKQLPHITDDALERAKSAEIEHIDDIMECEDDVRNRVLQLQQAELANVAQFCNRYPSLDIEYDIEEGDDVHVGSPVFINVTLDRDEDEEDANKPVGPVIAPFYPFRKEESWWCVVGDTKTNGLLAIKRVALKQRSTFKLDFVPPVEGKQEFKLYFMCDSYLGCDQEYDFELNVGEAVDMESSDDEDGEGSD